MKYLKLFENFDVYAFKKYTPDDNVDLSNVMQSFVVKPFSDEDIALIELKCDVKVANSKKNVYIEGDTATTYACAWSLEDYCYVIIGMDTYTSKPTFIQTFDQIDALIDGINVLIDYRSE